MPNVSGCLHPLVAATGLAWSTFRLVILLRPRAPLMELGLRITVLSVLEEWRPSER